ncbi:Os01g0755550 [Oryza sativa Japonica Group]|jgi:hypothetical protein|uniref:Os01g0755550 protein n=1 Tax=Oryza sativa subsp. japonica TaxID=39947 RepID=A0A0N7KDS1_ORYSJ|nr:hypothetical protein EE612_005804 [Oryza sativa]BAS74401.1 Os01g0755550 [Oryza sativa Japonica Group]
MRAMHQFFSLFSSPDHLTSVLLLALKPLRRRREKPHKPAAATGAANEMAEADLSGSHCRRLVVDGCDCEGV